MIPETETHTAVTSEAVTRRMTLTLLVSTPREAADRSPSDMMFKSRAKKTKTKKPSDTKTRVKRTSTQVLETYIWAQIYFSLNNIKCKFWNNGESEPEDYQHEYSSNYTYSGNRLDFYYNGGCSNGGWHRFRVDDLMVYKSEEF